MSNYPLQVPHDERYVTQEQVERELPFDHQDFALIDGDAEFEQLLMGRTSPDNQIVGLMETASRRLEDYAETLWLEHQVTETLQRPGWADDSDLPLTYRPIVSVSSVTVNDEAVAASDYWVEDTHLRRKEDSWPTTHRSIDVTYTYGHSEVPPDVTRGVVRLVRSMLDSIETDGVESLGDLDPTPPSEVQRDVLGNISKAPSYIGGASVI